MGYLKTGMLVEFEDGTLGVVLDDETDDSCATTYKQCGEVEVGTMAGHVKVLATAPKQDDKMFYRVAYAFGLTVKSRDLVNNVCAGGKNDLGVFKVSSKQELQIICTEDDNVKQELEQLVKEQKHLAGLQEDLAKRIEDVKAKL